MWKRPPSAIRVDGDVAYVSLTRGLEAIIDVADIDVVRGISWTTMMTRKGHAYAQWAAPRGQSTLMHRILMQAPDGLFVDHIDGDGLNNRRSNMRLATRSQNNMNMLVTRRNKIGVKGASVGKTGKFEARIKYRDQSYYLGGFETAEEASAAYTGAARVLFGDFAKS